MSNGMIAGGAWEQMTLFAPLPITGTPAMAEALRMAAAAKEDHDRMIHLRGVLSQLAWRAAEANRASEEERPRKMQAVLGELLSAARMQGLIRDEGGDFK